MVTANLSWIAAAGAVSYKVEYKLNSAVSWTLLNAALVGTMASIGGLDEGMAYDFRITSNCSTGTSSPVTITQNTPCKNVENLTADFVGSTVDLTWTKKPMADSYKIEYKLQASGTWTTASGSPLSNAALPNPVLFSIVGLTTGSAYDFRVTVVCEEGESTGEVVSANSECVAPTGLDVVFS